MSCPSPHPKSNTRLAPAAFSTATTLAMRSSLQPKRLFDCRLFLRVLKFVGVRIGRLVRSKSRWCLPRQVPLPTQVSVGDELALRVRLEPAFAALEQLVDLLAPDPVVVVVVEHGDEGVQVT